MPSYPIPVNEQNRVAAVKSYDILDTPAEAEFDAITELASQICGTPISLITLIDDNRQWFKSAHGVGVSQTSREDAFCSHTIANSADAFIVPDLRKDERFGNNPFVTGDPHLVFYAGVPLTDKDGFALGTLCVLDDETKVLTEFQLKALKVLADQIVMLFHLRRKIRSLQTMQGFLEERRGELQTAVTKINATKPKLDAVVKNLTIIQAEATDCLTSHQEQLIQSSLQQLSYITDVYKEVKQAE